MWCLHVLIRVSRTSIPFCTICPTMISQCTQYANETLFVWFLSQIAAKADAKSVLIWTHRMWSARTSKSFHVLIVFWLILVSLSLFAEAEETRNNCLSLSPLTRFSCIHVLQWNSGDGNFLPLMSLILFTSRAKRKEERSGCSSTLFGSADPFVHTFSLYVSLYVCVSACLSVYVCKCPNRVICLNVSLSWHRNVFLGEKKREKWGSRSENPVSCTSSSTRFSRLLISSPVIACLSSHTHSVCFSLLLSPSLSSVCLPLLLMSACPPFSLCVYSCVRILICHCPNASLFHAVYVHFSPSHMPSLELHSLSLWFSSPALFTYTLRSFLPVFRPSGSHWH